MLEKTPNDGPMSLVTNLHGQPNLVWEIPATGPFKTPLQVSRDEFQDDDSHPW